MNSNSTLFLAASHGTTANPPTPKKRGGGPKTPQGKARSARNALKHGAYAVKYPVLETESEDGYRLHQDAFYARFAPVDEIEKCYVTHLADIEWVLARLAGWEATAINAQLHALAFSPFSPGPDGQMERSTAALTNCLQQPTLPYIARRFSTLIRARTATLKALSDVRRHYPATDPDPIFLPDPLNMPIHTPDPSPAPSSEDTQTAAPSSADPQSAAPSSGDTQSAAPSSGDAQSAAPSSGDTQSAAGAACVPPANPCPPTNPCQPSPADTPTLPEDLSKRTPPTPGALASRRPSIA